MLADERVEEGRDGVVVLKVADPEVGKWYHWAHSHFQTARHIPVEGLVVGRGSPLVDCYFDVVFGPRSFLHHCITDDVFFAIEMILRMAEVLVEFTCNTPPIVIQTLLPLGWLLSSSHGCLRVLKQVDSVRQSYV